MVRDIGGRKLAVWVGSYDGKRPLIHEQGWLTREHKYLVGDQWAAFVEGAEPHPDICAMNDAWVGAAWLPHDYESIYSVWPGWVHLVHGDPDACVMIFDTVLATMTNTELVELVEAARGS